MLVMSQQFTITPEQKLQVSTRLQTQLAVDNLENNHERQIFADFTVII